MPTGNCKLDQQAGSTSQVELQVKSIFSALDRLNRASNIVEDRLSEVLLEPISTPISVDKKDEQQLVPFATKLQLISERINEEATALESYAARLEF